MRTSQTPTVRLLTLLVAAIAVLGIGLSSAFADVDAAEANLLAIVDDTANATKRAAAVEKLAAFDSKDAAMGLVEALEKLSERWASTEEKSVKAREQFEDYKGYSFSDPKAWDIKERLQGQMDRLDAVLRGDQVVGDAFARVFEKMKDPAAVSFLDKAAAKSKYPHARRELYRGVLRNMAVEPEKPAKRALADDDAGVRLAALAALGYRKDETLVPLIVKSLKDPGWPLRQAAVRALGEIESAAAIGPLVQAMMVEEGRLVEVFGAVLGKLAGETLGPYPESWRQWYDENKQRLADAGSKAVSTKRPGKQLEPTNYYGIQTRSRRIVFIIDISGSMVEPIGEVPKGPVTGVKESEQRPSGPKIEVAKKTLKNAIRKLPEEVFFSIIVFNHAVRPFHEKALAATQDNKNNAYLFVNDLQPSGATYTYGALKEAFRLAGRGASDKAYDPAVDTIFLLSDGAPTDSDLESAKPMEGEVILQAVRDWNKAKKIEIHTVAIDPSIGKGPFIKFMKQLAHQNSGTYTEIGQ